MEHSKFGSNKMRKAAPLFQFFVASAAAATLLGGCGKLWIRHPSDSLVSRPITTTELPPVQVTSVIHSVAKKGETLSAIARRYTGAASNWRKLEAANPKINAQRLRIGDRIVVPGELIVASEQPTARASLREELPPAAVKREALQTRVVPEKTKPTKVQSAKREKKSRLPVAAKRKPSASVAALPEAIPAPVKVEAAPPEPKNPANEMLSETTDLLPEFSSAKSERTDTPNVTDRPVLADRPILSESASKERVKRGLARKANLASELIDPARLSKRPKATAPQVVVEKPRSDTPPEVASTFLTCRADRCNIRVASE